MDRNQMWETIDQVIKENLKENEAMKSFGAHSEVILEYWIITNNTLSHSRRILDGTTLTLMTIPTLKIFTKEIIELLRENAERK